jgi:hypothetical protein
MHRRGTFDVEDCLLDRSSSAEFYAGRILICTTVTVGPLLVERFNR